MDSELELANLSHKTTQRQVFNSHNNETYELATSTSDDIEDQQQPYHKTPPRGFLVQRKFISGNRTYLAQVGNIHCFWHRSNGVPLITIGPTWHFTILLLILFCAILSLTCFIEQQLIIFQVKPYWTAFGAFLIIFTSYSFFSTLFGDPGIPEIIFTRVTEGTINECRTESYCDVCCIDVPQNAIHCNLCRVCILGHDHHCVFFSKCIGLGNIDAFNNTISFTIGTIFYLTLCFGLTVLTNDI